MTAPDNGVPGRRTQLDRQLHPTPQHPGVPPHPGTGELHVGKTGEELAQADFALNPEAAPEGQPQPSTPDQPPAPKFELPLKREIPKAGRNDPCPCGSGKKFKSCCGRLA